MPRGERNPSSYPGKSKASVTELREPQMMQLYNGPALKDDIPN